MSTQIALMVDESVQRILVREDESATVSQIGRELQAKLHYENDMVLQQIEDPATYVIVQTLLRDVARLFSRLSLIENNLHKLDTLLETLSILELVEFEARSLIDFIETEAMPSEGISREFHEVLDGISYGITHDVRRIFERELVRSLPSQSTPVVYGKIVHAHGLLTNCLQQSAIALLQLLNPTFDPLRLFNNHEERLEQSLRLCSDLSSLMTVVRQAEVQNSPDIMRKVVNGVLRFRDGSMQYLVYRDWRDYERMALELITAIDNNCDAKDLIHQFRCYLEVLYGHVKMRAVLSDRFTSAGELC